MGLEHLLNGWQPAHLLQTGTPPWERCWWNKSLGHGVEVFDRRKSGDGEGVYRLCSRLHEAPSPPRSARRRSCASSRCDARVRRQCLPHPRGTRCARKWVWLTRVTGRSECHTRARRCAAQLRHEMLLDNRELENLYFVLQQFAEATDQEVLRTARPK